MSFLEEWYLPYTSFKDSWPNQHTQNPDFKGRQQYAYYNMINILYQFHNKTNASIFLMYKNRFSLKRILIKSGKQEKNFNKGIL